MYTISGMVWSFGHITCLLHSKLVDEPSSTAKMKMTINGGKRRRGRDKKYIIKQQNERTNARTQTTLPSCCIRHAAEKKQKYK